MANNNQIRFGVSYDVDKSSIQKVKKSLQDLQNIKPASFEGTRQQLRQIQGTAQKVELALNKAFNVKLGSLNTTTFNKQLQEAGLSVDKIYTSFSKLGTQGQVAFSQMASSVLTTNLRLKETSNIVSKMGQTMANTAKWGIASSIMNSFTNEVKQAFQYVKSLDSALTDIRIVTGDSTEKMKQFAVQANQAAQALGRSTMDYSKAALTFYQQGLSDEQVQARTQSTLIAQNITGSGQEMADYLTAVWNGYKVVGEEAQTYVDKLAAVADSSASNMAQLATAMSKVASTANMLGVPVDKLNAQIATITATTRQAPQTVGNALKTIYARINDIATGSEDAQISLGNYSSKMKQVGFSVLDASGHLRDTGDVIDQIGAKWQTLSRQQQIYLARTMAGQRQYNNLLALFENWGKYTDLVTVSMESQGAAMEKNERYLDSLAAKIEQFNTAQERIKDSLINEDDLKGIVDFGTGFINIFGSLIDGIGGGKNTLLALGSIFTSVFSGTIAKQINSFIVNIQNARSNTQALKNDIANLQTFKAFGSENDAVRQITKHMGELQKYYSVLDQATINNQKNLINQLDSLQNSKMQITANKQAVEQYASKLQGVNTSDIWKRDTASVEQLNIAIDRLQGSSSNLQQVFHSFVAGDSSIQRLQQHFNEFIEAYNQINPDKARQLQEAFNLNPGSGQFRQLLNQALNQANNKANLYSETINTAIQREQELNNKTQQLTGIITENEKSFKQLFDVNSVVKFASGIGQVASIINTVVNLTKTWKEENISLGQKLTRTFTTVGFMIPMLVSAYKNISDSLGVQVLKQTKITLEKQKQLLLTRQKNIEQAKAALSKKVADQEYKYSLLKRALGENAAKQTDAFKNLSNSKKALQDLNRQSDLVGRNLDNLDKEAGKLPSTFGLIKSKASGAFSTILGFLSGPAGIAVAIGAVVALISVALVKAWHSASEAAKKAAQQMKAANDIYKESKDKLQDLKSSLESLKDAQNNLNELTSGTQQWKSALQDVNNQVIELLEKFPQLAKYVSTNANGVLQISEEGQDYVLGQQKLATQANAMGYISSRKTSDAANRQNEITQASRNWGMGAWDSSVLDNVITVIQEQGSNILENTKELQELTGASDKQIQAIDKHKSEIIALADKLTANTIATDSLTQSIITGTFIDPEKIASSVNSDIFTAQASKAISNATLDYSKYGIDTSKTIQNIDYGTAKKIAQGQKVDLGPGEVIIDDQARNRIVERYKEINADIADEISISGNKIIRTVAETGEKTELNFDDIMQAVATADATTAQGMEQIYKNAEAVAQKYISKFQDDASTIYKIGEGTQAAGQVSVQDLYNFRNDEEVIQALMNQTGKTREAVIQMIADLELETSRSIAEYVKTLSPEIKNAIDQLTGTKGLADLPEEIIKKIGSSLQNAWKNGTYDEYFDILGDLKPQDMEGFSSFIDSLGEQANSIDVSTFRDKLKELGISSKNVSDQQIQALIDKLRELNGINLQEGLGQLYQGTTSFLEKYTKDADATLNKKQFESMSQIASGLNMDLSQFFEQTWNGAYKLKTSAAEFFDYVNNQSLDGFKDTIDSLAESTINLLNAQNGFGNLSASDVMSRNTAGNAITTDASLDFLEGVGENSTSLDRIRGQFEKYGQLGAESIEELNGLLSQHIDEFDQLPQIISQTTQQIGSLKNQEQELTAQQQKMRQQFREMQLDSSVDVDSWKDLTKYLQKSADDLDEIADSVKDDKKAAEDLAEQILRFASASDQVVENFDKWNDVLNDSEASLVDLSETLSQLQETYKDLLGYHQTTSLGDDFLRDAQNLDLMKQSIQGVQGAYEQLQLRAGASTLMQLSPDLSFDDAYSQLQQGMADLQSLADSGDLEIVAGARIENEDFITGLQQLINGLIDVGDTADTIAAKANAVLDAYGIDAEVKPVISQTTDTQQQVGWNVVAGYEEIEGIAHAPDAHGKMKPQLYKNRIPTVTYQPVYQTSTTVKDVSAAGVQLSNAHFKSGGGTSVGSPRKVSSGGGGGKGGGGKGSSPKAYKPSSIKADRKEIIKNPYEAVEKSYDRQAKKLEKLNNLQGKLTGADRLTNLENQNTALKKQNDLIEKRAKISKNANKEGTTAYYAKKINKEIGKYVDTKTGQLSQTAARNAVARQYNNTVKDVTAYNKAKSDYEKWQKTVWNKYSDEQKKAHQAEQKKKQQDLKDKEAKAEKVDVDKAEETYKKKIDWIEAYKEALEKDTQFHEQYIENIRKIIENKIEKSKIKVDLSLEFGQIERQFIEFRDKIVRKVKKDDYLGLSQGLRDQIKSYVDSKEFDNLENKIRDTYKNIQNIEKGTYAGTYGLTKQQYKDFVNEYGIKSSEFKKLQRQYLEQAKQDLQEYTEQYMESLEKIQDMRDEIYENYLDSIENIQDKMDDVIDQYERINDLVQTRIKLVQLLYGDSGARIMDSYYQKEYQNTNKQLKALKTQADYWEGKMSKVSAGDDRWKIYKQNYENAIDAINSTLEDQLDLIVTKFQNRMKVALQNITNLLTDYGTEYLKQQWDYISKDDDAFLDVVNRKFGVDEIEQLYKQAIQDAGNTADQQRKINNLMEQQLKILNEKNKLTQYDVDRAKAALEVEKARMALEDSRNNKTKMRLRRDSQGNYTYQYVQDQQQLSDLEANLAEAQKNLYNLDKQHYQQQLNQVTDLWEDYFEQLNELNAQYATARNQADVERIDAQIKLLKDKYVNYFNDINNDLQYTLYNYLTKSFTGAMDIEETDLNKIIALMKDQLPYVNNSIQDLSDTLVEQGGILKATQSYLNQLGDAAQQALDKQNQALKSSGISTKEIETAKDSQAIDYTEKYLESYYEPAIQGAKDARSELYKLLKAVDELIGKNFSESDFIPFLQEVYQDLQNINNLEGKNKGIISSEILSGGGDTGDTLSQQAIAKQNASINPLQTSFNDLKKRYDTTASDFSKDTDFINKNIENLSYSTIQSYLNRFQNYKNQFGTIMQEMEKIKRQALEQKVQITATFPNVDKSSQIQDAINKLVGQASQIAGQY